MQRTVSVDILLEDILPRLDADDIGALVEDQGGLFVDKQSLEEMRSAARRGDIHGALAVLDRNMPIGFSIIADDLRRLIAGTAPV